MSSVNMDIVRSSKIEVDLVELAADVVNKLVDAINQLSMEPMTICPTQEVELEILIAKRTTTIEQLREILNSFSLQDLTNVPAQTLITKAAIANELIQEVKELGLIKANLRSNVDYFEDLKKNRNKRDENLAIIIQGMEMETNSIEEDDVKLRKLKKQKQMMKRALNELLDQAFPDFKSDIKSIIQELIVNQSEETPYFRVPETVDVQVIPLLLKAKIIEQHEDDPSLFRSAMILE